MSKARQFVGFRFPKEVVSALDAVAATSGCTRTDVALGWLKDRAVAEGWLDAVEAGRQTKEA